MPSTYSTNLAIELIGNNDQAGTWGNTTNTNLGTLIEQAISGYVTQAVSTGTDTTITIPNGSTGVARNMYIELTGTGGTNTNLIVPANKKLYFIYNNTSSGQVTVKVSGQTGVSIPNGKKMVLASNGTDTVNALNYIADFGSNSATITQLTATSATITNLTLTSLVISNLSIASANITTLTGTTLTYSSGTITNLASTSLTLSNNPTLSGGTANGVLYLNGSKVATSGSALTFDGTSVTFGSTAQRIIADMSNATVSNRFAFQTSTTNGNTNVNAIPNGTSTSSQFIAYNSSDPNNASSIQLTALSTTTRLLAGQTGTGSYLPITFFTNGTEQIRLDTSGSLGIGTSSPPAKLTVSNAGAAGLEFNPTGGVSGGATIATYNRSTSAYTALTTYASTQTWYANGSTRAMDLDSSGNLGIGTASPGYKLDVQGSATDFVAFNGLNTNNNAGTITSSAIKFGFTSTVGTHYATLKITEDSVNSNSGGLTISLPNGGVETPLLALTSAGNLGIGTSSPAYKLDVNTGQIRANETSTGSGDGGLISGTVSANGNAGVLFQTNGASRWNITTLGTNGASLRVYNYALASTVATFDSSGNLGIGTTTINYRVVADCNGAANNDNGFAVRNGNSSAYGGSYNFEHLVTGGGSAVRASYISSEGGGGNSFMRFATTIGGTLAERARITSGGEFLVNTANAAGTSGVGVALNPSDQGVRLVSASTTNGTETLSVYSTGAIAYRFYVGWGGTVYATNTTISAISDQRFKENVSDLDVGLDAVLALKPRKFDWKEGKGKDIKGDRGFIAQEFEQVFPDLVDEWRDPAPEGEEPYKSVRQDLIPVLVKAIQEQQAMIKSLEAKVAALESK